MRQDNQDNAWPRHTEGGWSAVNHPYQGCLGDTLDDWGVEDSTGERIVEVYKSDGLDEPNQFPAKERAHLIAAAPELLDALKRIIEFDYKGGPSHHGWKGDEYEWYGKSEDVWANAKAAIAKAEGR